MSRYGQCSDEELIERLRNGESKISDYLMEKYKGTVKKRARAMYLIGGETDDLIQEGMIGLLRLARTTAWAEASLFGHLCRAVHRQTAAQCCHGLPGRKHIPHSPAVSLSERGKSGRPVVKKIPEALK